MFVRMATERAAVGGVVASIAIRYGLAHLPNPASLFAHTGLTLCFTYISTAFAVASVLAFTGNAVVAALATVSLVAIVVSVLGVFSLAGWSLGIVEAVSITILVGLSCDFSLHLAEAFTTSGHKERELRAKHAVGKVGKPVVAAGFTTFFAVIPMLGCTIRVLNKFGAIIPACIVFSLFFCLHLFVPLLMVFGPDGHTDGTDGKQTTGFLVGLPSVLFRTSARYVLGLSQIQAHCFTEAVDCLSIHRDIHGLTLSFIYLRRGLFFLGTGTFFCLVGTCIFPKSLRLFAHTRLTFCFNYRKFRVPEPSRGRTWRCSLRWLLVRSLACTSGCE
jgi:hypothetical protein|tara:strand:- start:692 stop:1684 length:993 start_codon:yes stop_codon:yes gene_type:complete